MHGRSGPGRGAERRGGRGPGERGTGAPGRAAGGRGLRDPRSPAPSRPLDSGAGHEKQTAGWRVQGKDSENPAKLGRPSPQGGRAPGLTGSRWAGVAVCVLSQKTTTSEPESLVTVSSRVGSCGDPGQHRQPRFRDGPGEPWARTAAGKVALHGNPRLSRSGAGKQERRSLPSVRWARGGLPGAPARRPPGGPGNSLLDAGEPGHAARERQAPPRLSPTPDLGQPHAAPGADGSVPTRPTWGAGVRAVQGAPPGRAQPPGRRVPAETGRGVADGSLLLGLHVHFHFRRCSHNYQ